MLSYTEIDGEHFLNIWQQQAHKDLKIFFPILEFLSDIDSPTHWRKDFSFKNSFADSPTRRVRESPSHRLGESTTPRLAKSGSRWLPDSASRKVSFWLWISPRIWSQIRNGSKGSVRDSWGAGNSAKTPENPPHCHVPLNVLYSWQTSSTYLFYVNPNLEGFVAKYYFENSKILWKFYQPCKKIWKIHIPQKVSCDNIVKANSPIVS